MDSAGASVYTLGMVFARRKSTIWTLLAALFVTAGGWASVGACIEACTTGVMPSEAACGASTSSCHSAETVSSSGCCSTDASRSGSSCGAEHTADGCGCATCSQALSRYFTERAPVHVSPMPKAVTPTFLLPMPTFVPVVLDDAARSARIRTGPTQAQLCVYLR